MNVRFFNQVKKDLVRQGEPSSNMESIIVWKKNQNLICLAV